MAQERRDATVAVTGASGLVGSHIVEHLANQGFHVVAVLRKAPDFLQKFISSYSGPGSIRIETADVDDQSALERAFSGAQAVVHAAGSVDPFGSRESIFATNFGGTENALKAAATNSVKHFIFISSLSVITGQGDQYDVDESVPLKPCGESYADSKIEAEKAVMNFAGAGDMKVTSLRPGFIYGPRERSWMPRLINSIRTGKAMLIDGGTKQTNVIYVNNLARAVELTLFNERTYSQVYNLTDGQTISKKELFDAIADGLSLPRVTKKVPGAIAKLVCQTVSAIAPSLPIEKQKNLARFSKAAFRLAAVNQGFSVSKAERDLPYVNRISFKEGMSATLETFRAAENSAASKIVSEAVSR
ncbi:MAG: NAD-dependent epimerase/dehydratase family protein [Candidatus Melainabacteria bacterium]|nr:NAD-dependent epimerase/dehydratase family protein [Candidatus Melainabacteria bacterium]